MKTIQFKVDDNYFNTVLTLLNSLKKDMVKELIVVKDSKVVDSKSDEKIKLDRVKGILKNNSDLEEFRRLVRKGDNSKKLRYEDAVNTDEMIDDIL